MIFGKNHILYRKIKLAHIVIIILLFSIPIIIAVLGNTTRMGYIRIWGVPSSTDENTYSVRVGYYSKTFRNSDIYGVYPNNETLPEYITDIEWRGNGSPFGKLSSTKELTSNTMIDIDYKLKLKYKTVFYYIVSIIILICLYTFIKNYICSIKNLRTISKRFKYIYNKMFNQSNTTFSNINILYIVPIIFCPVLVLSNQLLNLPYYFAWDSSLTYATDSLLINGGITPNHLYHPDIGALWVEKFLYFQ